MKQIDRLVFKELVGPWLFGVGLFSSLLMAATYLGRLAGFLVDKVPPALVGQLVLLYLPAILVKTFTMAVLLAALLAFGRLSSDSELVAMRAGGASILRIVTPVMLFSGLIAVLTFWFDEQVVPSVSNRSKDLTRQIAQQRSHGQSEPFTQTVIEDNKLRLAVVAQNVNPLSQQLQGVTVIAYDDKEAESYIMLAKKLQFDVNRKDHWRVEGGMTIADAKFTNVVHTNEAWPSQMPSMDQTYNELTAERKDEFDLMSMRQLTEAIQVHRKRRDWTFSEIANAEYGYWNKIAVPIAAFVFGTLGAVLGIRNHRTGTAAGFALAIAIIFGYVALASFMNVFATGGVLPSYVASFSPITLALIASVIIMWRRNV